MYVICTGRCSGDFAQSKATKYNMGLAGLQSKVIDESLMTDITEPERAVAAQPGMYGRIWYGQALAFDEAYQILQDVTVHMYTHRIAVRLRCAFTHQCCGSVMHKSHGRQSPLCIHSLVSLHIGHHRCIKSYVCDRVTTGAVRARRPEGRQERPDSWTEPECWLV